MVAATAKRPKKSTGKAVDDEMKRMKAIHRLGVDIERREKDLAGQETRVASAKTKWREEEKEREEIKEEVDQMYVDLRNLSTGGFIDRLQFPDKDQSAGDGKNGGGVGTGAQAIKQGLAQAAADKLRENTDADREVFDKATLDEIGIKGALFDNLSADGIKVGRDLQAWFAEGHTQRAIRGVGPEAKSKLQDLMAAFYERLATDRQTKAAQGSPIDPDSEEMLVELKDGRSRHLRVAIAKREDGTFANAYGVKLDAQGGDIWHEQKFAGNHATREKSIKDAVGAVKLFIDSKRKSGIDAKAEKRAVEVVKALEAIEMPDGAPDAKGDPTPRDAEGTPKRFKGNAKNKR